MIGSRFKNTGKDPRSVNQVHTQGVKHNDSDSGDSDDEDKKHTNADKAQVRVKKKKVKTLNQQAWSNWGGGYHSRSAPPAQVSI